MSLIPYPFTYRRAKSLAEAEKLFAASPDSKFLAGGQTLIPTMKMRLANPEHLIDISGLSELSFIRVENDAVVVGAGTRHADVATSGEIARAIPALSHLASHIGDPAVRHLGTLGGSVANNDPAADYPAAVLGLGATVNTTRRAIPADAFFTGMFSTALDDGEIITSVSFPIPQYAAYAKFPNPASRYAMAGAFVAKFRNGSTRLAITGAAPCVFRMTEMEGALSRNFSADAIANIGIRSDGMNSDIHGSAEYRAHLACVMARRAVEAAGSGK